MIDPILSNVIPTFNIGNDGFNWWIGQVESVTDVKLNGGRVKVRIVGVHNKDGDVTSTDDLPWCHVMLPTNVPYQSGGSKGAHNLEIGCWVAGFYLDPECQKPIIMGSIGHVPGTTFVKPNNLEPGLTSLGFEQVRPIDIKPTIDRPKSAIEGENPDGSNADAGGAAAKDGQVPALLALNETKTKTNPTGAKQCIKKADAKCDSKDFGREVRKIIGDLLKENQQSGGKIGTFYVGKANGLLYNGQTLPRKYISKLTRLTSALSLRVKKEIVFGIREGIEELVKLIMGVQSAKDVAEKAGDKPKNPKESYVPNTERGNFLKEVIKTFNELLGNLGCSFTKTLDDLIKYVVDLVMEYLQDAFSAVTCLIDDVTSKIIRFLESSYESLISTVLGPIQDLLGQAGSFLDLIGGAVNRVLNFLGISCTGLDDDCNKDKNICSDGSDGEDEEEEEEDDDDEYFAKLIKAIAEAEAAADNFLDGAIDEVEGGSLTGKKLNGNLPRGVCNDARKRNKRKPTKVKFIGGVINQPIKNNFTASTTFIPDIPLQTPNYPQFADLPQPTIADFGLNTDNYTEYTVTAQEDLILEGKVAKFDIVGPIRNSVLEVQIDSSTDIPQESVVTFEECVINSADGIAVGLTVQVSREIDGVPTINILSGGTGYLKNMRFTIDGTKTGGTSGQDDITFTITLVGKELDFKIFGDVLEKGIIDSEIYSEFGKFTYTEPVTFTFQTLETNAPQPSSIGFELIQQRAADSIIIWRDDPRDLADNSANDLFNTVSVTTEKGIYTEGSVVFFNIATSGYEDGTKFSFTIFGSVTENDYDIYLLGEEKKVEINDSSGQVVVVTNIDFVNEGQESMTLLVYEEDNLEKPLASTTILVVDRNESEINDVEEEVVFRLSQDTTNAQLEEFLNSQNTTVSRDFADEIISLPADLGSLPPVPVPEDEPLEFLPPIAGTPVVDTDGSIINIPIDFPGNRTYQVAPQIAISGDGYGAAGIVLLDADGFPSEIRVTRIGVGYVPNLPEDNDLNCIIDSFTIIRPGFGYSSPPTIFVDGDPNIAEAIINDDGYISGVRVLNRGIAYTTIPDIVVSGGGGVSGFVLPNLVCLSPLELEQKGYVKIGTGKYIDCP